MADPNPATIWISWSDPYQHFLTDRLKNIASGMYWGSEKPRSRGISVTYLGVQFSTIFGHAVHTCPRHGRAAPGTVEARETRALPALPPYSPKGSIEIRKRF